MGILHLRTFIENYYKLQTVKVTGTLVIDGFGLITFLKCEGSHHCFHDRARKFFTTLRDCNIQPTVIFDGLQSGNKVIERRKDDYSRRRRTQMEERLCYNPGGWKMGCGGLTMEILVSSPDLRFDFIIAKGEADCEIVTYAQEHACPVLGKDTDFAIFDISHGYIPFKGFKWEEASPTEGGVMAEVFHFEDFAHSINFPSQHRLLFPAILGNDKIKKLNADPEYVEKIARSWRQYPSFDDLLSAIEGGNPETAILEYQLDGMPRKSLLANCKEAKRFYHFGEGVLPLVPREFPVLPSWAEEQFRSGRLHIINIQALAHMPCILRIQREDFSRSDPSHTLSKKIRAHTYGILLGEGHEVMENVPSPIEPTVRNEPLRTEILIPPVKLYDVQYIEQHVRQQALCDVLSCRYEDIEQFTPEWKLITAVTRFWYREAKPDEKVTKAIVACFLYCDSGKVNMEKPPIVHDFYLKVLHALAQWQQVYLDTLTLNQVLMEPYQRKDLVQFFDGDTVMYFASCDSEQVITKLFGEKEKRFFSKFVAFIRGV